MKHDVGHARAHQAVWDLLPWYLNGTVSPSEKALVEDHLQSCPSCRRELAEQARLKDVVRVAEPSHEQTDLAWAKLEKQISPNRTRPAKFAIAACLGFLAIGIGLNTSFAPKEYDVLTQPVGVEHTDATEIRIRVAPNVSSDEVMNVLRAAGLSKIGDLSETGVIVAEVDAEKDAAVLADILMS